MVVVDGDVIECKITLRSSTLLFYFRNCFMEETELLIVIQEGIDRWKMWTLFWVDDVPPCVKHEQSTTQVQKRREGRQERMQRGEMLEFSETKRKGGAFTMTAGS